jgi:ABC-type phosphate/phosphonate transport system permease subunit
MGILNEPGFWGTVIAIIAALTFTFLAERAIRRSREEKTDSQ